MARHLRTSAHRKSITLGGGGADDALVTAPRMGKTAIGHVARFAFDEYAKIAMLRTRTRPLEEIFDFVSDFGSA